MPEKQKYSLATKEHIKHREHNKCFFCETKKDLTIAHIFVWKCDDGLPTECNGMCICRKCHDKLDFGYGITREEQIRMLRMCQAYLVFLYCLNKDLEVVQKEIPDNQLCLKKERRNNYGQLYNI